MSIPNIFVMNNTGDVLIEKHFQSYTKRYVTELFWEEVEKYKDQNEVCPVIATPNHYLINVRRHTLFFLVAVRREEPPLLIVDLLHRIVDILLVYFKNKLSDQVMRENFALVYHILDEIVDGGFPAITELNQLTEMIIPSSMLESSKKMFSSSYQQYKNVLPESIISKIPWRKTTVKYVSNEIKLDIVEKIDAIVDPNGSIVSSDVFGAIECNCKLSAMPDLNLSFKNSHILQETKLHRCVRINRFMRERVISFVPPDGKFTLATFNVPNNSSLPITIQPTFNLKGPTGNVSVKVAAFIPGSKQPLDQLSLLIPFPKSTLSFALSANIGKVVPDEISKEVRWVIGKVPKDKEPILEGSIGLPSDYVENSKPTIRVDFNIKQYSVSGLKVDTLAVHNVSYKPFKGVRSNTRAGSYLIRG